MNYLSVIINMLILLASLITLGYSLKLYTEILKDKSQNRRYKNEKENNLT